MTEIVKIKENRDFRRIYSKGKSFVSPVLVTYVLKNRTKNVRYGITTSKKTGNAVQRNRSRRIIRAAFARFQGKFRRDMTLSLCQEGLPRQKRALTLLTVCKSSLRGRVFCNEASAYLAYQILSEEYFTTKKTLLSFYSELFSICC